MTDFDLAALDRGQYDRRWANSHLHPEEAVQAAHDLQAGKLLLPHAGRFILANLRGKDPSNGLLAQGRESNTGCCHQKEAERYISTVIARGLRAGGKNCIDYISSCSLN